MPIYCGKCLRSYTRKENWEKHFNQKTYKTDGFGHAANVCFNLEKGHPRVYDTTPEKAKTKYQSALQFKNTFNFKRAVACEQERNGVHHSELANKICTRSYFPDNERD